MWEVRIQHEGLRAFRVLSGHTQADAQWKATAQLLLWEQRWCAQQKAELSRQKCLSRQMLALHGRKTAASLTAELAHRIAALESILDTSLRRGHFLPWDLLKDRTPFTEPPVLLEALRKPAPQLLSEFYSARITLLDKLLWLRRKRKKLAASEHFRHELTLWQNACHTQNLRSVLDIQQRRAQREQKRTQHEQAQLKQHARVEATQRDFELHERHAVEYFFSELLSRSPYPDGFPQELTLQYVRLAKTLIVDYELPPVTTWPTHRQVRYVAAQNTLREIPSPEGWLKRSYENALYQIVLRVLSELFAHDYPHALDRIAFNGHIRSVDKATGNKSHACVLSVLVAHETFSAINLAHVDPRSCFRNLKGIASSKLIDALPIKPLMTPRGEHHPFLDSRIAATPLDTTGPLAPLHRSSFDTLIHEAFEREFQKNIGQVRLTQSGFDSIV